MEDKKVMASRKIEVVEVGTWKMYSILVAKNQKVIQIHRIKNSINFEANYKAMKNLTSNAYVLYMYLLMHENHRVWALSSKDVYNKTALTDKTYPKAVTELIQKGYLTAGIINLGEVREGTISKYDRKYKEEAYHLWEDPDMRAEWEKNNPELVFDDKQRKEWEEAHPEVFKSKETKQRQRKNVN